MMRWLVAVFKRINWQSVGAFIVSQLKGQAFKITLKAILGSAQATGFSAWLVKIFIKEIIIDKALEPAVKKALSELEYSIDVVDGRMNIKDLKEAKNEQDHNTTIGDILS